MAEVVLLVGTRKGLWIARSTDGRGSWKLDGPHFPMDAVAAATVDERGSRPRILVGATSQHWGPSVFRSDDLGVSWQEPEHGAIRFAEGDDAALAAVWQLRPAPAAQPGVVYAGTEPSALWRSTDGGETFSLIRGLWDHPHRPDWFPGGGGQAIHTVLPHPTDPDRITVAMSTGGVYRTMDGGASWAPSNSGIKASFLPDPDPEYGQCVHKVVANPARPERMYAQNHFGVYRSDDGGEVWKSIADGLPADFGFPIAVHPHDPDTVYVIPLTADVERFPPHGKLRVWRSTDAGEHWTELGTGLPTEPVYAAVMRDAMCTDDADPAGVYFGTRDGVVYASADAGESWSMVVRHLPDVLCVRAAVLS
jgi:photosystem II stability/assembly factor-like uncharacterized protein